LTDTSKGGTILRQAVGLLNAGQRPAAEIARALGIPRNRLYKWQKEVAVAESF
jgi:hypothetical protein